MMNIHTDSSRPPVRQMVREAIEALGGPAANSAIRDWVNQSYPGTHPGTIAAAINMCSVNSPSRIHWPENTRPRPATDTRYDFLFKVSRGTVERYDPKVHGEWEIARNEFGSLIVRQVGIDEAETSDAIDAAPEQAVMLFPLEAHLRDFLARNLGRVKIGAHILRLYQDESGREGVEYPTEVGPIDILAITETGEFVVFELKLGSGPDRALGQVLRYMGWVKVHLSQRDQSVRGVIVAGSIDEKLRYAASLVPGISLFEYELDFRIRPTAL